MGKLVIKLQGKSIGDVNLRLGDMTIGRNSTCDIVLSNDKSVSNKHAVIKTVGRKSTLEDLGSTNGTFIESGRVTHHELRHGETIIIGSHELIYRDDLALDAPAFAKSPGASAASTDSRGKTMVISMQAQLIAAEGKDKGKRVPLVKKETLLENPGKNPARIYRGPDGYVLHAQMGPGEPRLNDKPVQPGGQLLENGDIIEGAGTQYQVVI
ncbi:MAG: FHA domain-containing protein [Gammaproteobacteria bacterium]|nr:FHA domain-containing protein [Gammaproteobacteria bacterium]